ncbi:MAG: septum formation protein Maf [Lachnospiraceae bacterium]|nr:septum formation protein Maf [Lachnospiraceae bacterium]
MSCRIILASASPRRREILSQVGLVYEVIPSDFEEHAKADTPQEYVRLLAYGKAKAVADMLKKNKTAGECLAENSSEEPVMVIGADTVVVHRDVILQKPVDKEDAFRMLSALQGDVHEVDTGVAVLVQMPDGSHREKSFTVRTQVECYPVTKAELWKYLEDDEYADKAGGYAIQGRFAAYIKEIRGDYYNVVGLPVSALLQALKELEIN